MISILAPRAGRDRAAFARIGNICISILAPRAGRDFCLCAILSRKVISILAPRAGRDSYGHPATTVWRRFQSSRPVRGATFPQRFAPKASAKFQSSRPVRGATAKMHKFSCIFCNKQPIEDRNPASGAGRQSHLYIHADRYACKTECEPAFNWLFTCRSHYIISVSSGK